MKFSVSTWIYGDQDVEITFKKLKEFGYDAIELKGEPNDYSLEKLKRLSSEYGIEIISLAGIYPWPTNERDLSSPDKEVRIKAIEYLKECCLFANEINALIIIVSPTPVGKVFPTTQFSSEDEWKSAVYKERSLAISSLKKVSEYAQDINITLSIEPLNRYETFLINNTDQAINFISEINSDNVRLHLDTFHMNIEEKNLAEAIKTGKEHLVNLHIADSNRQAVGNGHIDFKSIINSLIEINYLGPVTLEPLPPISNPYFATHNKSYRPVFDNYLKESIIQLKEIISKCNKTT